VRAGRGQAQDPVADDRAQAHACAHVHGRKRKFGGDTSVIGRRIVADGEAREIIDIMPRTFQFLNEKPELIFPFRFERAKVFLGNFSYQSIARLRPGITLGIQRPSYTNSLVCFATSAGPSTE
jgi:hypothetical protein